MSAYNTAAGVQTNDAFTRFLSSAAFNNPGRGYAGFPYSDIKPATATASNQAHSGYM